MKNGYGDVVAAAGEPAWYDENGVPRYQEFHPYGCVNKRALEAFLVEVRCQACGRAYPVAITWDGNPQYLAGMALGPGLPLSQGHSAPNSSLHYGDPPNVGCCNSGHTMSSDFVRIIQAWTREKLRWQKLEDAVVAAIPVQVDDDGPAV